MGRWLSVAVLSALSLGASGVASAQAEPPATRLSVPAETNTPAETNPSEPGQYPDTSQASSDALKEWGELPTSLASSFPEGFGGVYHDKDGSIVVKLTGSPEAASVRTKAQSAQERVERTNGAAARIRFEPAAYPFRELARVQGELSAELPDDGPLRRAGASGVGLDSRDGSVVVFASAQSADAVKSDLAGRGLPVQYRVEVSATEGSRKIAGRYADSPPYNGGNNIGTYYGGQFHEWCTSGFGMHNATGHYLLTAGHCGSVSGSHWYNTNFGNPQPDRYVGQTAYVVYQQGGADTQIIHASSSPLVWKGPFDGTRVSISGAYDAVTGAPACSEGATLAAFGGENCTLVGVTNATFCYPVDGVCTSGLFSLEAVPFQPMTGDSGCPVIMPSSYGYFALGTCDGFQTYVVQGASYTRLWATHVQVPMFIWGLSVNTPMNP